MYERFKKDRNVRDVRDSGISPESWERSSDSSCFKFPKTDGMLPHSETSLANRAPAPSNPLFEKSIDVKIVRIFCNVISSPFVTEC